MTTQRRSERLRRKARQSTPGLSKPGAYTLYGSGYVVESEASFATSSQFRLPHDSRRARYAESPHCLQLETSDPVDEPRPRRASLLDAVRGALPDMLRRLPSQAYDAIAASPIARRRLRAPIDDDEDETDEIVPESDDEEVASQPARLLQPIFDMAQPQRNRAYIFLLAALFASGLILLTCLSSVTEVRPPRRFATQERIADWHLPNLPQMPPLPSLKLRKLQLPQIPLPKISLWKLPTVDLPSLPSLPPMPSFGLMHLSQSVGDFVIAMLCKLRKAPLAVWGSLNRFLFGGALRSGMRHISREEFAEKIYPSLLEDVRKIALEEVSSDAVYVSFRERYAADKGLPADYALASAGAAVIAADPSPIRQFARFVYAYADALVRPTSFVPAQPRRPSIALDPDVSPGMCWAFPGQEGSLTVRLARPVTPTAVTIEHTPGQSAFSSDSAPKRFRVYMIPRAVPVTRVNPAAEEAAESGAEPKPRMILLGEFEFNAMPSAEHVQTFQVEPKGAARAIKLEIVQNHGAAHTCLYRFRVHGDAAEL